MMMAGWDDDEDGKQLLHLFVGLTTIYKYL
jgi:hypothetical protein